MYVSVKTHSENWFSLRLVLFKGLVRDLNPGPLAPEARIIPLDQRATFLCIYDEEDIIYIPDLCKSGLIQDL